MDQLENKKDDQLSTMAGMDTGFERDWAIKKQRENSRCFFINGLEMVTKEIHSRAQL